MRMIDRDRDAWLQVVQRHANSNVEAFKLVWRGKLIPFEAAWSPYPPPGYQPKEEDRGKHHLHWTIAPQHTHPFGVSVAAKLRGIPPYEFSDEAEKESAILLAAEALLAFGKAYNGDKWDHVTSSTVGYDERLWTKESLCKSEVAFACTAAIRG